ncbi:zinc finger CCHC domain-containing protein 7 [Oryzias melastigma]|uniref:zinc finger CCHC domain-containing protein 7 n=1 Tax=Oryzias melastigma TaxID=30732 RepID=UPI000CF83634|nr:zinc finger CCHC domain-containing protein 7 [Oryzias melastigma]
MILGQGKRDEDHSISLHLEGASDSNTDVDEGCSWWVCEKDEEAQIHNKDRTSRTARQPNRYYTENNFHCRNCNKTGHLSKNCPKPKKLVPCFLCGNLGHLGVECPNKYCSNCGQPGHVFDTCSEKRYWYKQCHRCSMKGHFFDGCPEIWRQYHHTVSTVAHFFMV